MLPQPVAATCKSHTRPEASPNSHPQPPPTGPIVPHGDPCSQSFPFVQSLACTELPPGPGAEADLRRVSRNAAAQKAVNPQGELVDASRVTAWSVAFLAVWGRLHSKGLVPPRESQKRAAVNDPRQENNASNITEKHSTSMPTIRSTCWVSL